VAASRLVGYLRQPGETRGEVRKQIIERNYPSQLSAAANHGRSPYCSRAHATNRFIDRILFVQYQRIGRHDISSPHVCQIDSSIELGTDDVTIREDTDGDGPISGGGSHNDRAHTVLAHQPRRFDDRCRSGDTYHVSTAQFGDFHISLSGIRHVNTAGQRRVARVSSAGAGAEADAALLVSAVSICRSAASQSSSSPPGANARRSARK
jgi:hypothetical protein